MNKKDIIQIIILISILLIGIIITQTSCNKYKTKIIKVNGTIYDPNTGTTVPNATVTIQSTSINGSIYSSGYSDLVSATTDASGNFTLEFEAQQTDDYQIRIAANGYFIQSYTESTELINNTETHTLQYNIYPSAYIRIFVENLSPVDSLDMISYSITTAMPSCASCCNNTVLKGYEENYKDTIFCKLYGNQTNTLEWYVTKNGQSIAYDDDIFCTAFDTTNYNLNY